MRTRAAFALALGLTLVLGSASASTLGDFERPALTAVAFDAAPCTAIALPEVHLGGGLYLPAVQDVDRVTLTAISPNCADRYIDIVLIESEVGLVFEQFAVVPGHVPDPVPAVMHVAVTPRASTSGPLFLVWDARVAAAP